MPSVSVFLTGIFFILVPGFLELYLYINGSERLYGLPLKAE